MKPGDYVSVIIEDENGKVVLSALGIFRKQNPDDPKRGWVDHIWPDGMNEWTDTYLPHWSPASQEQKEKINSWLKAQRKVYRGGKYERTPLIGLDIDFKARLFDAILGSDCLSDNEREYLMKGIDRLPKEYYDNATPEL